MKFIYQDLLKFVTEQPSREELSKKLFQLGHEHEIEGDILADKGQNEDARAAYQRALEADESLTPALQMKINSLAKS